MKPETFEKFVPVADWHELWNGRHPDFRGVNELRLSSVTESMQATNVSTAHSVLVTAGALTNDHITYLENRDFLRVRDRKAKDRWKTYKRKRYNDVIQTILARPRTGSGGGIPLTRGEVAMLFLDGHAGDGPGLLDIRSQGYGEDSDWDGLTHDDIFSCDEGSDAAFVWTKWEPLELWPD